MKLIKVAASSINQTPLDWIGNRNRIIALIDEAVKNKVDILCLPELCITGYGCEDAFLMPYTAEKAWQTFEEILDQDYEVLLAEREMIYVSFGLPVVHNNSLYNCSVLVKIARLSTEILGLVPKQNLCADGVHYESRWFKEWEPGVISKYKPDANSRTDYPFGDIVFSLGGVKVGYEICEDAWSTNRPGSSLANRAVDIILNPSASHFSFNKHNTRKSFINEGSRAFRCTYVYSNLLGNESGRVIFDGDTYISSGGQLIAKGKRLSFKDHTLISAIVDLNVNRAAQLRNYSHQESDRGVIECNEHYSRWHEHQIPSGEWISSIFDEEDQFDSFEQAVALGLRDYMFKSHSKGFVVSLSGGADSAAVACLVKEMAQRARAELGKEVFEEQLTRREIPFSSTMGDCYGLLTCVYQATSNSSKETLDAADYLAKDIGAYFSCINVTSIVENYILLAESVVKRRLTWEQDDITLQNVQARVRAPSIWMIANIKQALLLTTSNRSEAAVGYCTMDGDTCGGLAPIAGVSKYFILKWLNHHECDGLALIRKQTPTAELRPSDKNQTDEADLMPYEILNTIEVMFVRDKLSPSDIYELLCHKYGPEMSKTYVDKFFRLFCTNQWKREKYSVSFHLDDESLDPKTFCRWPVLSKTISTEWYYDTSK